MAWQLADSREWRASESTRPCGKAARRLSKRSSSILAAISTGAASPSSSSRSCATRRISPRSRRSPPRSGAIAKTPGPFSAPHAEDSDAERHQDEDRLQANAQPAGDAVRDARRPREARARLDRALARDAALRAPARAV